MAATAVHLERVPTNPCHQSIRPQMSLATVSKAHACSYSFLTFVNTWARYLLPKDTEVQFTHSPSGGFSFCSLLTPAGPACSPACLPSHHTFPGGIVALVSKTHTSDGQYSLHLQLRLQCPAPHVNQQELPLLQQVIPVSCLASSIFQIQQSPVSSVSLSCISQSHPCFVYPPYPG